MTTAEDLLSRNEDSAFSQLDTILLSCSSSQFESLIADVWARCPKREFGHGVEIYTDAMKLDEVSDPSERNTIELYRRMRWIARRRHIELGFGPDQRSAVHTPLTSAIRAAEDFLESCGIDYEGWQDTRLFFNHATMQWHQIPLEEYERLWDGNVRFFEPSILVSDANHEEQLRKEFLDRNLRVPILIRTDREASNEEILLLSRSLPELLRAERFEPNTPFWHAINILSWYHSHCLPTWNELINNKGHSNWGRNEIAEETMTMIGAAYEIGRSHDALIKKPYEPHALRGMKVIASARKGALQTSIANEPLKRRRMERMKELIHSTSVDGAAATCETEGLGSMQAIKRQWYREQKKL